MTESFRKAATDLRTAAGVVRQVRREGLPYVVEHDYEERDDILQRLDQVAATLDELALEADLIAARLGER